jgi:type III secretion protein T
MDMVEYTLLEDFYKLLLPLLYGLPRLFVVMLMFPMFNGAIFQPLIKNTICISLLIGVYPLLQSQVDLINHSKMETIVWLLKEACIGGMMGYVLNTVLYAFQSFGDLIDNQTGMNNATIFEPFGGHQGGPMSAFMMQLGIYFLVAAGGLHVLIGILWQSYQTWPINEMIPVPHWGWVQFGTNKIESLMQLTIKLSSPLILMLILAELSMGLINKVAQQFNTFYFAMPIKGMLTFLILMISLVHLADQLRLGIAGWPTKMQHLEQTIEGPEKPPKSRSFIKPSEPIQP